MGHLDSGFSVEGEACVDFCGDAARDDGKNFLSEFNGQMFEGEGRDVLVAGVVAELLARVEQRVINNGLILRHLRGRGDERRVRGRILWLGFFDGFDVAGVGHDDSHLAELLEQRLGHTFLPISGLVIQGFISLDATEQAKIPLRLSHDYRV